MMRVAMYGNTDIGLMRRVNEDSFRLIPEQQVMVVCDGMGGHAAGEIASRRAVETVESFLYRRGELSPPELPQDGPMASLSAEAVDLVWAIRLANKRVFMTAQKQTQTRGMGTTLVAARFAEGTVIIGHVGDSRAYRFSGGQLIPLTIDHSLVAELVAQNKLTPEQARMSTDRNIITRALGTRPAVSVDLALVPAVVGDWIVLCSDGLCGAVSDDEIEEILRRHVQSPEPAIAALIDAANDTGGADNVTIAIGVIEEADPSAVNDTLAITTPESSLDASRFENSALEQLFGESPPATTEALEPDTDRIPIPPGLRRQSGGPAPA